MRTNNIRSSFDGRSVRPFAMDAAAVGEFASLHNIGVNLSDSDVRSLMQAANSSFGMDDIGGASLPGTIGTPVQFLQNWLPGFVRMLTAPRKIDELVGIMTSGSWEDEEIVQGVLEPTGKAVPYSDYSNIPLTGWVPSWERRTVVRFEQGIRVGTLDEKRSARMGVNSANEKRGTATVSLEIARNRVGFYGYNGGTNRTYGFLNDPSLAAYVNVAAGASASTTWALKTFLEITADLRAIMAKLQVQSKGVIDTRTHAITLAMANAVTPYLSVTSDHGVSVEAWFKATYPNARIVTAPELDAANGGANVVYAYAESVDDGATDGGKVWAHVVPAKFQLLGTEKQSKAYVEDFTNATAGVMLKRPYAVVRFSGM